ncbi:hypothetical protein MN116_003664, partial [Schistosoma mekongi]
WGEIVEIDEALIRKKIFIYLYKMRRDIKSAEFENNLQSFFDDIKIIYPV